MNRNATAQTMDTPNTKAPVGDADDFDFLMGPWHIRNTRLVQRLAGCTEWEIFTATGTACLLPGGIGNRDDFTPASWCAGYVGMALRLFNPQSLRWSIYWLDNVTGGLDPATDLLRPPVVGGFAGMDRGLFIGQDTFEGRPIHVQFRWAKNLATGRPCWEQAFSDDEGRTWETNWVMEFSRPDSR
ncbi:hypothetical protein [Acidovorax sp. BLS4]|uniref:hypothetical protein n=1 Tax=Acidovorax sp. BLS4 TaxID=3273430 RepID=UPI0029422D1C|nr:hypothetical protein [Paracidovorax avenae]WOI45892.1 hypothetical protein R1Z03_01365 [Paracidovorax avenae]